MAHRHRHTIDNPLNPTGVGWVNLFKVRASHVYISAHAAKFGRGPTVVSKKARLTLIIYIFRNGRVFLGQMENKVFRKNLSSSSGILCNRSFSSEDRVSQMTKTTATVTFHGHERGAVVLKSRQPRGGHYR